MKDKSNRGIGNRIKEKELCKIISFLQHKACKCVKDLETKRERKRRKSGKKSMQVCRVQAVRVIEAGSQSSAEEGGSVRVCESGRAQAKTLCT